MARMGARGEESKVCFERAISLFETAAATHAAARVEARLAETMWDLGRMEDGLERMNRSYELLARADVPVGTVISEYLDVAHAFFDTKEAKFANGVLDAVAKAVRPSASR